jgi:hypothetical protein
VVGEGEVWWSCIWPETFGIEGNLTGVIARQNTDIKGMRTRKESGGLVHDNLTQNNWRRKFVAQHNSMVKIPRAEQRYTGLNTWEKGRGQWREEVAIGLEQRSEKSVQLVIKGEREKIGGGKCRSPVLLTYTLTP